MSLYLSSVINWFFLETINEVGKEITIFVNYIMLPVVNTASRNRLQYHTIASANVSAIICI